MKLIPAGNTGTGTYFIQKGKEEIIVKHPVSKLNTKMEIAWGCSSIGGAILAGYGGHQLAVEAGRFMLAMCLGYMLFGLGIKRTEANIIP